MEFLPDYEQEQANSVHSDGEDQSILIASTNKLLAAVGYPDRAVRSVEELVRVASSMFVSIFEALFNTRIDGIIREPIDRGDYEHNAQLVIDALSEKIEMDLGYISGRDIVDGNAKALSNLVHILVRIVSITSHETLSSINTSDDFSGEENLHRKKQLPLSTDSITTRDSTFEGKEGEGDSFEYPSPVMDRTPPRQSQENREYLERFIDSHVRTTKQKMKADNRIELARKRKERALDMRRAQFRNINKKQEQTSLKTLNKKFQQDVERKQSSITMRQSSEEDAMLRSITKAVTQWKLQLKQEERKEAKERFRQLQQRMREQEESLQRLFEERLAILEQEDAKHDQNLNLLSKSEIKETREEMKVLSLREEILLKRAMETIEQKREREWLRKKEAYKNLLSILSVQGQINKLNSSDLSRASPPRRPQTPTKTPPASAQKKKKPSPARTRNTMLQARE